MWCFGLLRGNLMNDDLYIGYLPKMPVTFARAVRIFVTLAILAGFLVATLAWLGQKPFAESSFEFGTVKEFEGTIEAGPVPFLVVERTAMLNGLPLFDRFPLVSEGKHRFDADSFDGEHVRIRGTLIYRDDLRMIEVASGSVERSGRRSVGPKEESQSLGRFTLRGEIVDSKCYLGVMNPGASKPHRDCAALCLRGGIPPLFVVRDVAGGISELWLLSEEGKPVNNEILDVVAEPVEISGEVQRTGDQLFFRIDPGLVKRLP